MKKLYRLFVIISCFIISVATRAQVMFPPSNLHVDSTTLFATWSKPHDILLSENFEGVSFPPTGWMATTEGQGWIVTNHPTSYFQVPSHTNYAVATDHIPGQPNNGCCDYLITPEINLTNAPGYVLSFQSFYNGELNHSAYIDMSIDNGASWITLYTLSPAYSWQQVNVDLSFYSGANGLNSVLLAFHSYGYMLWGSGWAIDDVKISSEAMAVIGYQFFVGDSLVLITNELSFQIPPPLAIYGDTVLARVAAMYIQGQSTQDSAIFISQFLMPPADLEATSIENQVHLSWNPPADTSNSIPGNLLNYNLYLDNQLIAAVDKTMTDIWITTGFPGTICYYISAVYDLSPYGFAGQTEESKKNGPACTLVNFGYELPFTENWDGGQFDLNKWDSDPNWVIDTQAGNNAPCAGFKSDPVITNYSSSLESYYINSTTISTTSPYKIWLDFDLMLSVKSASSSEKLCVEIWDGSNWIVKHQYLNAGNFNWESKHINITGSAKNRTFKIRFRANGINSGEINYWEIDNIHIYYDLSLAPPQNLTAIKTGATFRETQLNWEAPSSGYTGSYILDDNTAEDNVYISSPGEGWLGNEFIYDDAGVLLSATVFLYGEGWADYSIDVFDADKNLLGSSDAFSPNASGWTTVELPEIEFSGTFYIMIHMYVVDISDHLPLDQNGMNSAADPGRYYDGTFWYELTDLGFAPSVCFIRAYGLIGDKKAAVTFNPGRNNFSPDSANELPRGRASRYQMKLFISDPEGRGIKPHSIKGIPMLNYKNVISSVKHQKIL